MLDEGQIFATISCENPMWGLSFGEFVHPSLAFLGLRCITSTPRVLCLFTFPHWYLGSCLVL